MSMRSIATVLVVALFSQTSLALLPPLSQSERESLASDIATGYVVSVKKRTERVSYGTNDVYTVTMIVNSVEKGNSLISGHTVSFNYWKANNRPARWTGDAGEYGSVKHYEIIKAYLVYDERSANFSLIKPNGFDHVNL